MSYQQHPTRSSTRRTPRCRPAGVIATALVLVLVLCVLAAACVLNWNALVLVHNDLQAKSDILALAAAPALLDEDRLIDYPAPVSSDQTDDLQESARIADEFRQWNNRAGGSSLAIRGEDLKVCSGFVADVSNQFSFQFDSSAEEHNTIYVRCERLAEGENRVKPLLAGLFYAGGQSRADLVGAAYATLDNLVVGFRPTATLAAPLMPMAIDALQWDLRQPNPPAIDTNGNRIREMYLQLRMPEADNATFDANAVLIDFGAETGAFDSSRLARQVADGVLAADLPGAQLGPVTGADPTGDRFVPFRARQSAGVGDGSLTQTMVAAVNGAVLAAQAKGKPLVRVFPLCRPFGDWGETIDGTVDVIGFVGCRVLGADEDASHGGRLRILVEPSFVIHPTVWTESPSYNAPFGPAQNLYVYKLRLSR